jgi:protein-tyrosine kinase
MDHLIERAAAKLREAKGGIPDRGPADPAPVSDPPPPIAASTPAPPPTLVATPAARSSDPPAIGRAVPGFKPFTAPPPNAVPVTGLVPSAPLPFDVSVPPAAKPESGKLGAASESQMGTGVAPSLPSDAPETNTAEIATGPLPVSGPAMREPVPELPPSVLSIGAGRSEAPASLRPAPNPGLQGATTSIPPVANRGAAPPTPMIQLDALERAGMVVARTTRTRISEEYRIAIGRILRSLHEASDVQGARNVLMVTSARPGEGKSFTALNLAGSIAQNGTDAVLLIDVDPKVRPLSDQLGLGEAQGFLDLVSDPSLRPEDLLRVTAIPNLAIMPVGTRLGGAAQTVGGTASTRPIIPTITRLARRFPKHLIMLDAPPCLSTSDPHTLAPHVGQVVLVVEAERTQRSEVEAAVELVRVCPTITMLLNKVRMTTSHTFGAYDYFGSYT